MRQRIRKGLVAISGGIVLLAGVIMIPYPGPGWLVVFVGLGILATEFAWAGNVLAYLRLKYRAWERIVSRQPILIRSLLLIATGCVVVATIWLVNGFGIANTLLSLQQEWLISPLFR